MTTTTLTNDQTESQPAPTHCPDLPTDLLDSILTHTIRHWWQAQHTQLSSPATPQPPIPSPPMHIVHAVPSALAPSAPLAALAPFVAWPQMWDTEAGHGYICVDKASYTGNVRMLDALLKLYQLGLFPPVAADKLAAPGKKQEQVVQVDAGAPQEATDQDQVAVDADEDEDHVYEFVDEQAEDDNADAAADDDQQADQPPCLSTPHNPLIDSKFPFLYTTHALNAASSRNDLPVLTWWLHLHRQDPHKFPLVFTEAALDNASWHGHVRVLDWWLESGLKLRYSWAALADATEAGHVDVLDWWLRAEQRGRVERDYSARVLDRASVENHVDVLDWWVDNGDVPSLNGKYSEQAVGVAAARGHVDVLKWWRAKVAAGVFPASAFDVEKAVRRASACARTEVLEWVLEEGLLTEAIRKALVHKLSIADGAEFREWKESVREWWVKKTGIAIPALVEE